MSFGMTSVLLRMGRVLETQTVATFVNEMAVSMPDADKRMWTDMIERAIFNNNNALTHDCRFYVRG